VRKRVAAVFNRRQDEFVSLLEWNNYLEQVEELVFEIVNGSEKERRAAEERLKEYAESNKREIEENLLAEREAGEEEKRREEAEIDAARRRRALAARQVAEERAEVAKTKRDVLDRLAGTNEDAGKITRQAEKILAMNQERRRGEMAEANARSSGLTIRGLRQKVKAEPEKPYDPFGGLDITPTRFVLQNDYKNDWLESAKNDTRHMSGGYSLHEYYYRTMFEAFSGLGVFIEDEAQDRQASPLARRTAATGTPGIKTNGDDIF
jgi:CDK-activating kinase assembly factor MAT1